MARTGKRTAKGSKTAAAGEVVGTRPKALSIAGNGIRTAGDFADFMSTLMTDVVEGRVTPSTCNAACNAGGKLLRIVELQMRQDLRGKRKRSAFDLVLAQHDTPPPPGEGG